jgi:hypothetical protein
MTFTERKKKVAARGTKIQIGTSRKLNNYLQLINLRCVEGFLWAEAQKEPRKSRYLGL